MKAFLKINILKINIAVCLCLILLVFYGQSIIAQTSDDEKVSAEVSAEGPGPAPTCNNNGICEAGETIANCPNDCSLPPTRGGNELLIYGIKVNLSISKLNYNVANISWDTSKSALCKLYWGKTAEYEDGALSEVSYRENHFAVLGDLQMQTIYHFQIFCQDSSGSKADTKDQQFTTLPSFAQAGPLNVSNLKAVPGDEKITLSWKNPTNIYFNGVRIVRSDRFYPASIDDGEVIYEGRGNYYEDKGLINGKKYYYALFTYDKNRNYSSGAVISAVPNKDGKVEEPGLPEVIPGPAASEVEKITINDFEFYVNGQKVPITDGKNIELNAKDPLTILIRYEKTPEILKTLLTSLEKEGKFFSFLLSINKDKTYYSANILSPETPGIYPMIITVMDYKNQALKRIEGELIVKVMQAKASLFQKYGKISLIILLIVILLAILILFLRRKKAKGKKILNLKF